MEFSQVFVGLFGISFAYGLPLEEYYVNGYPNQQFYYNYQVQPRSTYFYPNDINKPEIHPELGMSFRYHDTVYNYVKDFAGIQPPPHVNTVNVPTAVAVVINLGFDLYEPVIYNTDHLASQGSSGENFEANVGGNVNLETANSGGVTAAGVKEETTEKPGLNDYFLPSDFLSLPERSKSQYFGQFDALRTKMTNPKAQATSLPPINGVISNYVLLRDQKKPQGLFQVFGTARENEAFLQHNKRQTPDNSDGVEILAEPSQNKKMSDEVKEEPESNKEEQQTDVHPGIAQSKPSAIALAGPGGMAQASPVGTALVGQGGLAVAAPSGTAVAGPAGQGAIPIQIGGEKQKKETTEKSEDLDSY